jgi:hypothetical protein
MMSCLAAAAADDSMLRLDASVSSKVLMLLTDHWKISGSDA